MERLGLPRHRRKGQRLSEREVSELNPRIREKFLASATVCVLKIVRQLVSRLVQLDVIRAGHDHHDDPPVLGLLDRTPKLRPFRLQLTDRCINIVAHQRNRVMSRVIVGFALPIAVCRVHAHLAWPRFENEPIVIPIFGHILPAEHIPEKRSRRVSIVGVNQSMN